MRAAMNKTQSMGPYVMVCAAAARAFSAFPFGVPEISEYVRHMAREL
jgi:hypothetical protein